MALLWDLSQGDESALERIEANLVGSILVCPRLLDRCEALGLQPSNFGRVTVGAVYRAILDFVARNPPAGDGPGYLDPVALANFLESSGVRPSVRWPWLLILSRLTDDPSMDEWNVDHYTRVVIEGHARRLLGKGGKA